MTPLMTFFVGLFTSFFMYAYIKNAFDLTEKQAILSVIAFDTLIAILTL